MDSNAKKPQGQQNAQRKPSSPTPQGAKVGRSGPAYQPSQSHNATRSGVAKRPEVTGQGKASTAKSAPQAKRPISTRTPQGNAKPIRQSGLSDNLRSQTPLQRQMKKKNAPSEPGTVRRTTTQHFKIRSSSEKRPKQQRKRTGRSFRGRVVLLGIIAYLILLPIAVLIASLMLKSNVITGGDDFRYQLGEGKNTLWRKTYSHSRVCRDGIYYIDMDSLAEYCDLTTTGDGKTLRYVVRESGESVEFTIGESIAYINGVSERTGGNSFMLGGSLHVPLEFAKRCFLNLEITLDTERNRITIVRETDSEGNYLALDFPYKLADETDGINFAELEVEIQELIIQQNQPELPETENGDQPNEE